MTARDIIWAASDGAAIEHLRLSRDDEGLLADGLFVGRSDDLAPFRLHYLLRLTSAWELRAATVRLLPGDADAPGEVSLSVDPTAIWRDSDDTLMPELNGCHEIDISTSAFTKSLPIRRLALAPGESAEISVAHIDVPRLRVEPVRQRYTCIEPMASESKGLYRYEPLFRGSAQDLQVDADGLVIEYPGLFRRAWIGASQASGPQPESRGVHAP